LGLDLFGLTSQTKRPKDGTLEHGDVYFVQQLVGGIALGGPPIVVESIENPSSEFGPRWQSLPGHRLLPLALKNIPKEVPKPFAPATKDL
jgi:hypothetical protein